MEIDSGVRMFDSPVRKVLKTVRKVESVPRAEAIAETDMIAELEVGAEVLTADRGLR